MFGLMRVRGCPRHNDAWQRWRNDYCGTCKTIGTRYGHAARFTLNHDIVFLTELLNALTPGFTAERSSAYRSLHCMRLPRDVEIPGILRYSAAATLVLTEFSILDHMADTSKRRWRLLASLFSRAFRKARRDLMALAFPMERLHETLASQSRCETEGRTISEFAAPTAMATGMFFSHGASIAGLSDACAGTLDRLGRYFGELIYLLDAFEDYDKDRANGAFNAIRAGYDLTASSPLPVDIRSEVVGRLRGLATGMEEPLGCLPLDPQTRDGFLTRLRLNLERRLGSALGQVSSMPVLAMPVLAMADESDSRNQAADSSGGVCALMCCSKCLTGKWCCCCDDPSCCLGPPER